MIKLRNIIGKVLVVLVILGYLFEWGPVIVLGVFSFSNNSFGVIWESFTTKWYVKLR